MQKAQVQSLIRELDPTCSMVQPKGAGVGDKKTESQTRDPEQNLFLMFVL